MSEAALRKINEEVKQYCTFRVGNTFFGVPVLDVQEVIRPLRLTRVPLASANTKGLINLRGQIVTLISLSLLFSYGEAEEATTMNVVVRNGDSLAALVVDEIHDVMDVEMDSFEEAPETLSGALRTYTKGIHKLDGRLLIVLDLQKILDA